MIGSGRQTKTVFLGALFLALVFGFFHAGVTTAQQEVISDQRGAVLTRPRVASFQGASTVSLPFISKSQAPPSLADSVIELVNQERVKAGCAALAKNSALMNAALVHSTDMALNDYFSHTGSDGSTPASRATQAGYNWSALAENIAAGYSSPESVVAGWMSSSGHRDNILNCSSRDTGVGYYYLVNDTGSVNYNHYWTQMFGVSF